MPRSMIDRYEVSANPTIFILVCKIYLTTRLQCVTWQTKHTADKACHLSNLFLDCHINNCLPRVRWK